MSRTDYKLRVGGSTRCRCSACGEAFAGLRAFDTHRVGEWDSRQCLDLSEGDVIPVGSGGLAFEITESDRGTYWSLERRG